MHDHGRPLPPDVKATVDLWVSDFADRPASREVGAPFAGRAGDVLGAFLEAACHGGQRPEDLDEHAVSHALLDHLSGIDLPAAQKNAIPPLVAAFLGDLEDVGRLAGGRGLGAHVRAAAPAFRERALGRGPDLRRPGPKLGRNDPCPCGSGRKYKACCLNLLG